MLDGWEEFILPAEWHRGRGLRKRID